MMDEHFALFAEAMERRIRLATQFSWSALSVAPACLGNEAGVVGAGAMALLRAGNPGA
jgi:hypothetical protein